MTIAIYGSDGSFMLTTFVAYVCKGETQKNEVILLLHVLMFAEKKNHEFSNHKDREISTPLMEYYDCLPSHQYWF